MLLGITHTHTHTSHIYKISSSTVILSEVILFFTWKVSFCKTRTNEKPSMSLLYEDYFSMNRYYHAS